jgi:hypothetical protein
MTAAVLTSTTTPKTTEPSKGGGWIHSAPFDALLILGSPLLSFLLGWAVAQMAPSTNAITLLNQPTTISSVALKAFIHAHLFITVFRSHGNASVRVRHPVRFFVVPAILLVATIASEPLLIVAIIVAAYWDNIHSSLQTFGLGRIYDMKAGADVEKGRQLDIWLNYLMYWTPFMAGPIWGVMLSTFVGLGVGPDHWLARTLTAAQPWFQHLLWFVVPPFLAVYGWHTAKRVRAGEKLSWQKYALFASTALTSVSAWGFNPFGQALLIVNVFHAVQYFAIVWWSEKKNLGELLGTGVTPVGQVATALVIVLVGGLYGFWLGSLSDFWAANSMWLNRVVLAITNVVALLHFWYDGFIWSVRKKHV